MRWGAPEVLSEYHRSTSFCIQPVRERLGASGRIGVAVRNSWVIELWHPNHFTFWWCSKFQHALGGGNRVYLDTLGGQNRVNIEMHSGIVMEQVCRCTWRPWSCEFGAHNQASLKIHLEAVTEWLWGHTWRPWSNEVGDMQLEDHEIANFGGHNRASLEMHLEAVIEQLRQYTWRP
jgi:hypothetical protein